jgi:hypothetical protein
MRVRALYLGTWLRTVLGSIAIAMGVTMVSPITGIVLAGLGLAGFVAGQLALAALLSRSRDLAGAVAT